MNKNEYFSIPQLAKLLGLSRIAVYRRVKKGQIKAIKIGRVYAIPKDYIVGVLGKALKEKDKQEIETAVRRTIKEYGEVLKLLGQQ